MTALTPRSARQPPSRVAADGTNRQSITGPTRGTDTMKTLVRTLGLTTATALLVTGIALAQAPPGAPAGGAPKGAPAADSKMGGAKMGSKKMAGKPGKHHKKGKK